MDPTFVKRLAFVKYLYTAGVAQSQAPEPMASVGLLMLHDAVELFLDLACEHLNVTGRTKLKEFKEYWGAINACLSSGTLSQEVAMLRLNKARVALKHHGGHPSTLDLESYRATAIAFFADNFPVVFGVDVDDVSLIDLIQPKDARDKANEAADHLAAGKFDDAARELAVAFEMAMDHCYTEANVPFGLGRNLSHAHSIMRRMLGPSNGGDSNASQAVSELFQSVSSMQAAMRLMIVGLDFRRYLKFRAVVPPVHRTGAGAYMVDDLGHQQRNAKTIQDSIDFLIDASLQMNKLV